MSKRFISITFALWVIAFGLAVLLMQVEKPVREIVLPEIRISR